MTDETANTTNRRAIRGNTAALLANLNDSDDDSDDDNQPSLFKQAKTKKTETGGLYMQKVTKTKQEIKSINQKFETVESERDIFSIFSNIRNRT